MTRTRPSSKRARRQFGIAGVVALFVGAGAPAEVTALDRREQLAPRDALGRPVTDAEGNRLTYTSAAEPAQAASGGTVQPPTWRGTGTGAVDAVLDWYWAISGSGIGSAGMVAADLDGDGSVELVTTASASGFSPNSYWYVLAASPDGYVQKWVSLPYAAGIQRLEVAQLDGDPDLEIAVASGGSLLLYDGASHEVERSLEIEVAGVHGLALAQLDADAAVEAAICGDVGTAVYDLESGLVQLELGYGCSDLAVGETDGTPGLELVVADGTSGWVFDAVSGALEWDHPLGFGDRVALADLDGDGLEEIAAGFAWSGIQVWHGDTHGFYWERDIFNLATLTSADVDGNGSPELVQGDAQWGYVSVLEGTTGDLLWWVGNPEHGVTRAAVGDLDGDGTRELFFGAGFTSSGADHLYAADVFESEILWQTDDLVGPFTGLAHGDVDADGARELVFGSFGSESGYGGGRYFIHDARSFELEYESANVTTSSGLRRVEVANVDDDPALEIFLGTNQSYAGIIQCRDGASQELQWDAGIGDGLIVASLQVADIDGDDQLEVVTGGEVVHTGATGPRTQTHVAETGLPLWVSPNLTSYFGFFVALDLLRVGDIDGDPQREIVFGSEGGNLMALDAAAGTIDLAFEGLEPTSLEVADRENDGSDAVFVGTPWGEILVLDPETGATPIAGGYGGPIYGLTLRNVTGSPVKDFVFVAGERLHLVDGETLAVAWASGALGPDTGRGDGVRVGDLDGDGGTEIWLSISSIGHMVLSLREALFADGFESGDAGAWSAMNP